MDPSTRAYIDPAILAAVSTGDDDSQRQIPVLGLASTEDIRSSDPNLNTHPAVASLDQTSSSYSTDPTTMSHKPTLQSGDISLGGSGSTSGHGGPGTTDRITSGSTYPDASPNPYPSGGDSSSQGYTSSQLSGASANQGYTSSQLSGADTHSKSQTHGISTGSTNTNAKTNTDDLAAKAASAKDTLAASANPDTIAAKAANAKNSIASSVEPTVQGLRTRVNQLGAQATTATQQAADHPVVQNAKQSAEKQVGQFREFLGNFPVVKDLEKRTGVDRVVLVAGGVFAYLLLVPLNLFGLALPVTQFLTFVPPTILALDLLERRGASVNDEDTKTVLAYFVVLGFIQVIESLAPGVLARRIPQYWTVKLIFLAYLIHPQTKGALKIHNQFLRNLVVKPRPSTKTPPTSNPFRDSSASSPTFSPRVAQDQPQDYNIPKVAARGEGFEVVSELH